VSDVREPSSERRRSPSRLGRILAPIGVVLAAAFFLFEEFGWKLLTRAMHRLARLPAVARLEAAIQRLGPYPALALFLVPIALLEPLKLLALWLFATGHLLLGLGTILFAKVFSTALVARLFQLLRPSLMALAWFRRSYEWLLGTREWLYERVNAMPAWRMAEAAVVRIKAVARLWSDRLGLRS
jgi:hypothetical protein